MQGLLVWNPFRTIQPDPQTVLETLVNSNTPLGGNTCPANATSPTTSCPPGFYCPSAAVQVECPIAYFCPGKEPGNPDFVCARTIHSSDVVWQHTPRHVLHRIISSVILLLRGCCV